MRQRPILTGGRHIGGPGSRPLFGNKEEAVNLIRLSLKEGRGYDFFHPCEDFESLADYPPYVQLMKPKG